MKGRQMTGEEHATKGEYWQNHNVDCVLSHSDCHVHPPTLATIARESKSNTSNVFLISLIVLNKTIVFDIHLHGVLGRGTARAA